MGNKNNYISNGLMKAGGAILSVGLIPIILGFGPVGIVAGSIAAGIQSGIGLVSAGSVFATMTSLGMSGYFFGTSIVGAATVVTGAVTKILSKKWMNISNLNMTNENYFK